MQSSNVPWRPGTFPWLRGTISYQAPARAIVRSASKREEGAGGQIGPLLTVDSHGGKLVGQQRYDVAGAVEGCAGAGDHRLRGLAWRLPGRDQRAALARLERDRLPRRPLDQDFAAPGGERVGPRHDAERRGGQPRVGTKRPTPSIVLLVPHRDALPHRVLRQPPIDLGGAHVVPVAEDVGPHLDGFAGHPLDRIPPSVDARVDVLDAEPPGQAVADDRRTGRRLRAPGNGGPLGVFHGGDRN